MLEMQRSTENLGSHIATATGLTLFPYILPALLIYNKEILTKLSPTEFVENLSTSIILEAQPLDVSQ